MRPALLLALAIAFAGGCTTTPDTRPASPAQAADTAAVSDPEFWIRRLPAPDAVLLEADAIAAQNAALLARDASMHDLAVLPGRIDGRQVRDWVEALLPKPGRSYFDGNGQAFTDADLDALRAATAREAIAASVTPRFGLVVRRTPLRALPTLRRAHSDPLDTDIDRWQETAEFPGTPVAVLHDNGAGWLFVVAPRYRAWVQAADIAIGTRAQVLDHAGHGPFRIVTGAKAWLAHAPDDAALSELQLDMGTRLPLAEAAGTPAIHGQAPAAHWVLQLPRRGPDGSLRFTPALLPKSADSAAAPLPATRANIIRQAFKFLGERYGWGHDYNGRDCSGFVSEVYRSLGIELPRNTGDQARSPALRHVDMPALDVGDLVYIPGHVMLYVGQSGGQHWVIHDVHGSSLRQPDGSLRRVSFNGVVVTPLEALHFEDGSRYLDRVTAVVRPAPAY